MDYKQKIKEITQALKDCKRKDDLTPSEVAFAVIGRIPLFIVWALLMASYHVMVFFYEAASAPIHYLESWQQTTKKDVGKAAECAIYFVTTPTIFFLRVLLAASGVGFFFLWFFIMLTSYIITAGEIQWRPYITADDYKAQTWTLEDRLDGYTKFSPVVALLAAIILFIGFIGLLCENIKMWGICSLIYIVTIVLICCFKKKV